VDALTALYSKRAQAHTLLAGDIELNAQGLEIWLDRQLRPKARA